MNAIARALVENSIRMYLASLDHFLLSGEGKLYQVVNEYVTFCYATRPNRGLAQEIPERLGTSAEEKRVGKLIAFPVLNGLPHDCR